MAKFSYRARGKDGKEIKGYKDADTRYELARILKNDGLLLLSAEDIAEAGGPGGFKLNMNVDFLKKIQRVKLSDKIIFSKNLAVMIGAGLTITRALDALGRETDNKKFSDAIKDLVEQIKKGRAFSEALAEHENIFPPLYVSMVEAGEKSGKLKESLLVLSSQMQSDYDLVRKVRGAMMYPMIIVLATGLIGILMLIYVVPTLTSVFEELDVELPASTRFIITMSDLFKDYSILMLGFVGGISAGLYYAIKKTKIGKHLLDTAVIKAPLIGPMAKKFNAARTSRTLSSLISSGVSILESLEITSRVVQNHLYSDVLIEAKAEVQRGETMSKVMLMHTDIYPSLMSEMLSVGEETGESSKMLEEVAKFYEDQVSDATRDLSTIIEPVLMILIGGVVGFFAVSMITPMYSLSSAI
ncbi:MAG: type II secretion system F family protein [bacterium]|nr:type II secretion system F family protein [bacterium]